MNVSLHSLSSSPNAALSSHSTTDSSARRSKKVRGEQSHRTRKTKRSTRNSQVVENCDDADASLQAFRDCLQQAEVCHLQAQEAARLKRFKAARGLFSTAIALCQRALGLREKPLPTPDAAQIAGKNVPAQTVLSTDEICELQDAQKARAYLHELTIEMTTYSELARSLERPLRPHSSS